MDVDYLVLADAVDCQNGKLYIQGAGWDTLFTDGSPAAIALALRIRVPWTDTNQAHTVRIDLVNADGASVLANVVEFPLAVGRPLACEPGSDQVVPFAFGLRDMHFTQHGQYAVVVRIDGEDRARAPFRVAAPVLQALVIG